MNEMSNLKYRILVIDRDSGSKKLFHKILDSENIGFDFETSASRGLRKILKKHYDLIVSEISANQEGMSGLELLQNIRKDDSTVPFIVISDETSIQSSIKAVNYGVAGYLAKPIAIEEAKETIKRAIRFHKGRFVKNELRNYQMENAFYAVISSNEQSILKLLDTVDNLIELVYPKEYGSFPDLKMAIYEGLSNAVEHGNENQPDRKIYFRLDLKMDKITVHIKDEGSGFISSQALTRKGDPEQLSRGLQLINYLMDEVGFNIKGNEINLLKILQ